MSKIDSILFPEGTPAPTCSACDHYAGNEKLILKSFEIQNSLNGIFDITCDLEDGASVGNESGHRKKIIEILLSSLNVHKKAGVRLHDFDSEFFSEDATQILNTCGKIVSHITVPKITSLKQAKQIIEHLNKASKEAGLAILPPIHFLIETHQALREVWEIAGLDGVRGLDFGIMDYVSSFQGALSDSCMRSPEQFENPIVVNAKTKISTACHGNNIIPSHNVTIDFKDPERTFDDALRARVQFGYLRMWSIHPNQIEKIIEAFKPDFQVLALACSVISEASDASWGPIKHQDKLFDKASYRYYWTIIKKAHASQMSLPDNIKSLF